MDRMQLWACNGEAVRQAIAFEQLRTQHTHIIGYAGGYFELFETLSFVHMVLQ